MHAITSVDATDRRTDGRTMDELRFHEHCWHSKTELKKRKLWYSGNPHLHNTGPQVFTECTYGIFDHKCSRSVWPHSVHFRFSAELLPSHITYIASYIPVKYIKPNLVLASVWPRKASTPRTTCFKTRSHDEMQVGLYTNYNTSHWIVKSDGVQCYPPPQKKNNKKNNK